MVARSNGTGIPLVLMDTLDFADNERLPEGSPSTRSNPGERVPSSVPLLFDVAIRCIPRDSPRKRITEGPWLEGLFLYLMQKVHLPIFSEGFITMSQQSYQILEQILQTAIDRGVSLDTTVLRDILKRYSSFLEVRRDPCRWSLIGKILELDANVFLMPVEVEAGSSASPYGLLKMLFARITETGRRFRSTMPDDYKYLRSSIVLPLLREFAKARDLSGFLNYWRTELKALEKVRFMSDEEAAASPPQRSVSIWEEMDLTKELRHLMESSLTPGQIKEALLSALPDFMASLTHDEDFAAGAYSSVVVIEAILGAVQHEETADLVSATVADLATVITPNLDPYSDWPEHHRWQLWRLATLINLQWRQAWSTAMESLAQDMRWPYDPHVKNALKTIKSISASNAWLEATSSDSNEFLEVLHAFQYLLSFDPSRFTNDAYIARSAEAVDRALDAITPFLEDTLKDAVDGKASLNFNWDGRPESVASQGSLVVALTTSILRFPRCLK